MTRENKEEVVEAAPEKKPKLTLIVGLSIVVGVLLTLLICGSVYHFMSRKAITVELAATKAELKSKTLLFNDLQTQLTALSKQMHALKDFSVAKAYEAAAVAGEPHVAQPASTPPPAPAETEAKKPEAVITSTARKNRTNKSPEQPTPSAPPAPEISEPPARKAKPASLDCQIVGKSPEEQMATLKRCTQAMDGKK